MKISRALFYLLLFFLPTQLGRHFFFDFSFIAGLPSDYLAPVFYVTDGIIILLFCAWTGENIYGFLRDTIRKSDKKFLRKFSRVPLKFVSSHLFLLAGLAYVVFTSIFVAGNSWIAVYKFVKLAEYLILGLVIIRIKPKLQTVIYALSVGVFYSSILAIWQFINQSSAGGLLWFLGERTFRVGTPGIAAFSWGGKLILRPYATFPHPNVLGGFLTITVTLLFFYLVKYRKVQRGSAIIWLSACVILGSIGIFLTFSRSAWICAVAGFTIAGFQHAQRHIVAFVKKHGAFTIGLFYFLIVSSVFVPYVLTTVFSLRDQSWYERTKLIERALVMWSSSPFVGVGLGNFTVHMRPIIRNIGDLFLFQPVHNVYLLVLAETGLAGVCFFLIFLRKIFWKSVQNNSLVTITLLQLFFLGFFDHYLFTLQQGQLLFAVFTSLAFLPKNTYTDNTNG